MRAAQSGALRLFMEYATLAETIGRLPRFAKQFKVPEDELRRILNEDWLPHIEVVKIPLSLRGIDERADGVAALDADDYPAAALAALLSPCILLTHNYRDFGPLGVVSPSQGVDGLLTLIRRDESMTQAQALVAVPMLSGRAMAATTRWAAQRMGSSVWLTLGILAAGGALWILQLPPEKRARMKRCAATVASFALQQYGDVFIKVQRDQAQLNGFAVPAPGIRSAEAAIIRSLANSPEPLSACRLFEIADPRPDLPVAGIRAFLRKNDQTLFNQVRRGSFMLGRRYDLAEFA
ncbi:hypothetical protein [Actinoplanes sp. NPDC051859]|uniref:hypothetical protein n=1 Tax=Actinoplanes sp. NPDC051859 TaxID=3363909 RepID=UPI0037B664BD